MTRPESGPPDGAPWATLRDAQGARGAAPPTAERDLVQRLRLVVQQVLALLRDPASGAGPEAPRRQGDQTEPGREPPR